jgi:predicted O-linked N-acetylglucosamine transferase (SPINDLY family)/SAM-dependent methyltransferase
MNRRQRRLAQAKSGAPQAQGGDSSLAHDFREAVAHLQQGRLQQSEAAHRRVLAKAPHHAPSLHHLGLIAFKRNARAEAVDYIQQSLAIDPDAHQAWLNLAVILGEARRLDEAIEACRRCLALQASAQSYDVLGNLMRVAERSADAAAAYADSLRLNPDQPDVLARLGEQLLKQGRSAEALVLCRDALARNPDDAEARKLELRALATSGDLVAAEAILDTRLTRPAERARACDELSTHLRAQSRFAESVALQQRAIAEQPDQANYYFNLALALEGLGRKQEALGAYQAGLALEPDRAEGYAAVACLLRNMESYAGAITAFEHAIKLNPELAETHYNLAVTYKLMDRLEEARAAFDTAIACAPQSLVCRIELTNLRRTMCDWAGLDREERTCLDLVGSRSDVIAPFVLMSMPASRAEHLAVARRYARSLAVPQDLRFRAHDRHQGERRVRIGYLSADFFEHATALLIAEVLEKSDRTKFELFAYCYSPDDGSEMRRRIVGAFDHFVDIRSMSHHDAARRIHSDGIDILVDLKGYTRHARSEILAYRPAPIQVNYLGYPGTMGADFVDYILADAVVAPTEHQEHYAERIVHLPHCYQPNDRQRQIASDLLTRAEAGLPEDGFVFCSFNNNYKFTAPVFDVWMRLLGQVPGSVLWLLVKSGSARENLKREATARGIDPARIVFADRMGLPRHLARHALADLFLDSLPCNAHTTASDALWAGLPVLTCMGETFAGRVAASLVTAMGTPELIAGSLEDYEQRALALARDKDRLTAIRRKIIEGREASPLFDSTRYTRNLERAYETMVNIMRSGDAPRAFAVEEQPRIAPTEEAPPLQARIAYERCPLCESADIAWHIEAKVTGHPLYKPQLPPTVKWRNCTGCGHVFTEGYFTPEACEIVFSSTHNNQKVGNDAEGQRRVSARIVERMARHAPRGDWLDIGVGNGSLVFTAAEWGYTAVGTDLRTENIETLRKLGFEAHCRDIEEIDAIDRFSVVSMADVLEHVPLPGRSLAAVHRMMRRGGALFVSMPNMDTIVWRAMDASGVNPYWGELEHYHNFTRARLVRLLEAHGFKFAEYNISERYRSCMEVVALKV